MSRKKICRYVGLMLTLLISLTLIAGCGTSKKEIMSQYKESVQPILSELTQESKKWDELRNKNGKGQISNIEFAKAIKNELLPNLVKLQERMEAIEPDKNLRSTHELGIKMISKNVQAMNEVMAAVYNGDMSKITSANNLLTESREIERKYVNQLDDYVK